jgi:hypothetical protein
MGIYDGTATDWETGTERQEVAIPAGWKRSAKAMICPNGNCKYRGPAAQRSKGSRIVLWVLMALLLLPGLIYGMLFCGQEYCCPRCRNRVDLL